MDLTCVSTFNHFVLQHNSCTFLFYSLNQTARDRLTVEKASLIGGAVVAVVFALVFIILTLKKKKTLDSTTTTTDQDHEQQVKTESIEVRV